ncbi:hypothetical protein EHO61_06535 [Leptospira fluminis]|uniref:Uncharacterized protein n=1 Tax=Leptospira fluminis TaxID=2484979 RepID=A0A4R9GSU6_9LEPT|nr:hypothetical protein [Leptospira fluminis]TGK20153.1 hypothetical protein EHO61_06535 [Leptospira fluminis]
MTKLKCNNLTEGESLTRGYEDKGIIKEKKVRVAAKHSLGEFRKMITFAVTSSFSFSVSGLFR